jgi:hypothetical protein
MLKVPAESSGHLTAKMLASSWRSFPTPLDCSVAELEEIAPLLLRSGAAALIWRRVLHSDLPATSAVEQLHDAYRHNILQAVLQQQTIERVIARLRAAGIEPILVKGWAVARLYPEQGLRPCGDIDLCVRPEQFAAAKIVLEKLPDVRYDVDLHKGFEKFGGGSVEAIYARSQLVRLGETDVRVLCAEDNLRVLCIHLLREGAWRPLWLCDVALTVESRSADFDWTICLSENQRQADWLLCAIQAAHQLLGARVNDTPAAQRRKPLPKWLVPTILKEWETRLPSMTQRHRVQMSSFLSYPAGILKGLRHRWPNPIEATVSMRASFNGLPRLPFQFGNCLARTCKFAARLPKLLREQRHVA